MRVVYAFPLLLALISCQSDALEYKTIQGKTMGTTYNIVFETKEDAEKLQLQIDSLLIIVNQALSTYIPDATVSKFNNGYEDYLLDSSSLANELFLENYDISLRINKVSQGAFDPTVMPVVNYWGFGYDGRKKVSEIDSSKVDSLMQFVGFEKIRKKGRVLTKAVPRVELDFSGVAKGFGVDQVAKFLEAKNILNFYVEIGGDLYARGLNPSGIIWRTGISVPLEGSPLDQFQDIVEVSNKGIATSGNYRNYYESNGEIFSHTINPKSGFPERSKLLSATIIADNCALADGYATACMVLGLEKSIEMINLQEGIEGRLVYANEEGELEVFDSSKK